MQSYNFKSKEPTVDTEITQLTRIKFVAKQMSAAPLLCLASFVCAIVSAICDIASVVLVIPLLDSLRDSTSSSTLLNKNFSIRVAICNHRSKKEDFDLLIDKIIEIGNNLTT